PNPTNYYVTLTDSRSVADEVAELAPYPGVTNCAGLQTNREDYSLSEPYSLAEFAQSAWQAARNYWAYDEGGLAWLIPNNNTQCIDAQAARYKIFFNSHAGYHYVVRWDLMIVSSLTGTNIYQGLSWSGTGTGAEMATDWYDAPDPQ